MGTVLAILFNGTPEIRQRWRPRVQRHGTTLLEIMFALVILATAMIPIASVMGYGAKTTVKDFRTIEAIQFLQKTANMLLQEPYRNLPLNQATYASAYALNPGIPLGTAIKGRETTYAIEFTCVEVSPIEFSAYLINVSGATFDEGNPQATDFSGPVTQSFDHCVKRLQVRVMWVEPNGTPRQIDAITFRADLNRRG